MHNNKTCAFILCGDECSCIDEKQWRIDSQRKEIERLQADKVALTEMLTRARESLEFYDIQSVVRRIDALLATMQG